MRWLVLISCARRSCGTEPKEKRAVGKDAWSEWLLTVNYLQTPGGFVHRTVSTVY